MIELAEVEREHASGGSTFGDWVVVFGMTGGGGDLFGTAGVRGVSALGNALSNYYGRDFAIELFAAGNMGA